MLPVTRWLFSDKRRPTQTIRLMRRLAGRLSALLKRTSPRVSSILAWYRAHPSGDPDIGEALAYLAQLPDGQHAPPYPYGWCAGYRPSDAEVHHDPECGLHYVVHGGKRLYYPAGLSPEAVAGRYIFTKKEQDPRSPHRYLTPQFDVPDGAVVFDIGAAEADFTLSVIERIHHAYIFETLDEWRLPLRKTFAPWKDKVTIISKFASDNDKGECITLDSLTGKLPAGRPLFLKLDVEGAESAVLRGARQILSAPGREVRAALCTYHRAEDHRELSATMRSLGYSVETTPGYMIIYNSRPPYFRRGLIRCRREG